MHSTFPRLARALLVGATLAISAAAAGPALAAPPPRDEALEEAAAARKPPIPSFQDPDIAIQIRVLRGCEAFDLEKIKEDLARNPVEPLRPRDVRITCASNNGAPANVRIAIYLNGNKDELEGARNQGLARINLTAPLESAIRVHPRLTELLERRTSLRLLEIEDEKPHLKFKHFGPNGPRVRFVAPNQVVTTVKGKDTRPWPDVSFTTTITDTLSVREGVFSCTTRAHTNANTTVHKGLLAAGILTAPANFGVAAAGFGAQLAAIELGVAAQNREPGQRGPGCQMLLGEEKEEGAGGDGPVFPSEVSLDGSKLGFFYNKAGVENGGLVARFTVAQR
jgi:hypothetical protein